MNKPIKLIILILILIQTSLFCQIAELNKITVAIKNANTKTIYEACGNSISLSIPGVNGKFSRTQARQILEQFFKKNEAVEVKSKRTQSENDSYHYSILDYRTQNKQYNILIQFKKVDAGFLIQTIQIQEIK